MPDISIGRLRGGFCVYWNEGTKRRRYRLEAQSRAEAEAEAVAVYRRETYKAAPKGQTVADLWEAYRADLGPKPTAKTMGYTGKAVLAHFGAYQPEDIDQDLCRAYHAARVKEGIATGSVHTELGHLRSALSWAKKVKLIDSAPHVWLPPKPDSDMRILNKGEMRALVEAAVSPHIKLALILLLGTGARVGAVLDLTWDRVDLERGVINYRIKGSETRKGRAVVPMSSMVRAALQTAHHAALSDFVIEHGAAQVKSIRKGVMNAIDRSGIGHVRIHDLRHTAAVTMLGNGEKIEMVAQVLGHSNTATTFRTYARYLPQHMQGAIDVLDFMAPRKDAI